MSNIVCDGYGRVNVEKRCDVKQQLEVGKLTLRLLSFVLLQISLELVVSCWLVSVLRWEIVNLQNIVVLFMLRLAMGEGDDEERGFYLLHGLALREHSWYDLIRARLTNLEMLAVVGVAEDVVALKCLTLVRHHVAFNAYIFSFGLHYDSHKLRHFETVWVVQDVLLLKLCGSTNLV